MEYSLDNFLSLISGEDLKLIKEELELHPESADVILNNFAKKLSNAKQKTTAEDWQKLYDEELNVIRENQ